MCQHPLQYTTLVTVPITMTTLHSGSVILGQNGIPAASSKTSLSKTFTHSA